MLDTGCNDPGIQGCKLSITKLPGIQSVGLHQCIFVSLHLCTRHQASPSPKQFLSCRLRLKTMTSVRKYSALLIFLFIYLISFDSYSQAGCTDPTANNYNASATCNNGSCTYNTTSYTPPLKQ